MQMVQMFTIRELLATPAIKWNQTKLAELLDVNRSTLRKYMDDTANEHHAIIFKHGKYWFLHSTHAHGNRSTIYG